MPCHCKQLCLMKKLQKFDLNGLFAFFFQENRIKINLYNYSTKELIIHKYLLNKILFIVIVSAMILVEKKIYGLQGIVRLKSPQSYAALRSVPQGHSGTIKIEFVSYRNIFVLCKNKDFQTTGNDSDLVFYLI